MVMSEAIGTYQSVRFKLILPDTGMLTVKDIYFTPKRMLFDNGCFSAVGIHHVRKRIESVNLHEITDVQLRQHRQPKMDRVVEQVWSTPELR